MLVLVKGAGDLASGVAFRLFRSGFAVVMTETSKPTVIRRAVAFAEAVYEKEVVVEGVKARLAAGPLEVREILEAGIIPVLVDPGAESVNALQPAVVVDAILAKKNLGTRKKQAPLVIGLGPGFSAGEDVDLVVETMRGHSLGRVIRRGPAIPNTGLPGEVAGHSSERVLRAPVPGKFTSIKKIGDRVSAGEIVARVEEEPVLTPLGGVLRGLLRDDLMVSAGMKIGDVDPRAEVEHCFTISDKALAIGGGVLEAILSYLHLIKSHNGDEIHG